MTTMCNITAMITALALGATALAPAAGAHDWNNGPRGGYGGNGYNYQRHDYDRRDFDRGRYDREVYRRHKHHDNTGKYVALGLGALMLGIIASEASRH
jgi:hypothetical protein